MFSRFGDVNSNACARLRRGGVSANVKLRHLTYMVRSISGVFRISAVHGVLSGIYRVSNGACNGSGGASVSVHTVASRTHTTAFVVDSNVVPSGRNENCILHHVVHETIHRNGLVNVGHPFFVRLYSYIVDRGGSNCPRLVRGGRLVAGIVAGRRTSFGGAVSRNLTLLDALATGNNILSNRSTFGLCSACNFPVSLAISVLTRGNVSISRTHFGRLVGRRHRGTEGTHGTSSNRD